MHNSGVDILEENYNSIITNLTKIYVHKENLERLKYNFKDQIASVRRFENITTMGEFIKVLETRCVIGCNNISKVYDIVENIESKSKGELGRLLNLHSFWLSRSPPHTDNLAIYKEFQMSSIIPEFSLSPTVVELISSKIKRSWKSFARALEVIQEKDIDMIEELDDGIRTRKCLELFITEVGRQTLSNPYERLLRALDIIDRKDVRENVENLLIVMFKEK